VTSLLRLGLLGLALVTLTGCGGNPSRSTGPPLDHDRYVAALDAIARGQASRDASILYFRLASGGPADSPQSRDYRSEDECRAGARAFANHIEQIVTGVAALNPPVDIADVHDRSVAAASTSASLIEKLADDVEAGRVACGQEWNRRAFGLPSTEKAEDALEEYAERGYALVVQR
jgi:hypothetical protein